MFSHYLTATIRNIKKNKTSFIINLIGLSLGLASAFIISSYVLKETSYDNFHTKKDRIYRVLLDVKKVDWISPRIPYVLKEKIDSAIPNVEKTCVTDNLYMAKIKEENDFFNFRRLYAVTPEFFDIFDYKVVSGMDKDLLNRNNSIVITETTAKKYFIDKNPIGETLEININNTIHQLVVEAVIEDFPGNSSIKFNALCNFNIALQYHQSIPWTSEYTTSWTLNYNSMYVLLKDQNTGSFQSALNRIEKEAGINEQLHFTLQPLTEIHLNSNYLVNDGVRGKKSSIYLFTSIAVIILIVAIFNYIILSISMSRIRYKEIGVRKILGSSNQLIRKQFLTESILISLMAFPVAYLIACLGVEFLNNLFNINLKIDILKNPDQLMAFMLLLITTGLIAGSYIALYLSKLNPIKVLKSKFINHNRKIRLQYVMTVFQIMVFAGLTGASFSIFKQIDILKKRDLGIDLKNKITVNLDDIEIDYISYQALNNIFSSIPEVNDYTMGTFMPPENSRSVQVEVDPKDETRQIQYEVESVAHNFFDFFKIDCIQGRLFGSSFKGDSNKIVVNQTFVERFGFENPIGKMVRDQEIIGVIKDFHNHSLHEDVSPTAYFLVEPEYVYEAGIEYNEGTAAQCVEKVQNALSDFNPDGEFKSSFIYNEIDEMYSEESNLNNIIIYFSLFALIISLIGIFGQSLFAIKQQTKEIGIRKVNGATSKNILFQYLRQYTLLCIIANVISWPIVLHFFNKWQQQFIYKTQLSIWVVLLTFCLSTVIVLLTVARNAWKLSQTNPVNILKYE